MVTNKATTIYVVLILNVAVILAVALVSHLVTVRSMSVELERWHSLGNSLTDMTEECESLLPLWPIDRIDREEGVASWYGEPFHGRQTSNGEVYDMYGLTAAHRTLPLPSYVHVTNLANDRSVVLRVNDRGPFVDPEERIIDVSYAAAETLGIVEPGLAKVRVRTLDRAEIRNND